MDASGAGWRHWQKGASVTHTCDHCGRPVDVMVMPPKPNEERRVVRWVTAAGNVTCDGAGSGGVHRVAGAQAPRGGWWAASGSADAPEHQHHGRDWDAPYAESDQTWSGNPNHTLVTEVADLAPGRALDVGCGEGADAVWLADHGWQVTALEPSALALSRARRAAETAGVIVNWLEATLAEADLPQGSFDLVSVFYPALESASGPIETLASLVAPGGVLLVVHHADMDRERATVHGCDPAALMQPDDVAAGLDEDWTIEVHERRPRVVHGGAGADYHDDLVVRACLVNEPTAASGVAQPHAGDRSSRVGETRGVEGSSLSPRTTR